MFCVHQAFAGERSCYQSLVTYSGQYVAVGTKGVHVMTLRTWKEVKLHHVSLSPQAKVVDILVSPLSPHHHMF